MLTQVNAWSQKGKVREWLPHIVVRMLPCTRSLRVGLLIWPLNATGMAFAASAVRAGDGRVPAVLPLPVAGLISGRLPPEVAVEFMAVTEAMDEIARRGGRPTARSRSVSGRRSPAVPAPSDGSGHRRCGDGQCPGFADSGLARAVDTTWCSNLPECRGMIASPVISARDREQSGRVD